jgi:hypothetical protein
MLHSLHGMVLCFFITTLLGQEGAEPKMCGSSICCLHLSRSCCHELFQGSELNMAIDDRPSSLLSILDTLPA